MVSAISRVIRVAVSAPLGQHGRFRGDEQHVVEGQTGPDFHAVHASPTARGTGNRATVSRLYRNRRWKARASRAPRGSAIISPSDASHSQPVFRQRLARGTLDTACSAVVAPALSPPRASAAPSRRLAVAVIDAALGQRQPVHLCRLGCSRHSRNRRRPGQARSCPTFTAARASLSAAAIPALSAARRVVIDLLYSAIYGLGAR